MPILSALTTYVDDDILTAAQLNGDFGAIRTAFNVTAVLTDTPRTISAGHTFTGTQIFTPNSGVGIDVTTGGVTIVGDSTLTGSLAGLTGLTVASGGVTVTAGGLTVTAGGATITAGNLTMGGGQAVAKRVDDGDSGAADTIDWNAGNLHRSKLTGNCTYTFSNPQTGASYVLEVLQDATGSRTVTWPATVKWDGGVTPTLTTTASRKDVFAFLYNGAVYIGAIVAQNVNDAT